MKRAVAFLAFLPFLLASVACHSKASPATMSRAQSSALVAARPFKLEVPDHYDPSKPAPLLLALHGYGSNGDDMSSHFGPSAIALAHGIFVAHPDGTRDRTNARFWNATDACCNFGGIQVDDVAYLSAVVDDVAARYAIDAKRVWVMGLSNGGFLSHRLACEMADKVAAIVSIAGATWNDPARCAPTSHVSVLEVHGASDPLVRYDGGAALHEGQGGPYPSVDATVAQSAAKDGCTGALATIGTRLGFDSAHPSSETEMAKWTGCPAGVDVERWKMVDTGHIPRATPAWSAEIVAWLEDHPKAGR